MSQVSVIIPVYNAGKHFKKCIESILNQTLKNIEIILVLDCPTDGTDKLAEEYAAKDSRIKLIYNEKNLHVGESRNRGMLAATGEYINFTDHDDICHPEMFEDLYTVAKQRNANVVYGKMQTVTPDTEIEYDKVKLQDVEIKDGVEFLKLFYWGALSLDRSLDVYILRSIHTFIYSRQYIQQHKINFLDTKQYTGDDVYFTFCVLQALIRENGNLAFISKNHCYYLLHNKNTFKTQDWRNLQKCVRTLSLYDSFFHNNFMPDSLLQMAYYQFCIRHLYTSVRYYPKYNFVGALKHLSKLLEASPTVRRILITPPKTQYNIHLPVSKKIFAFVLRYFL